MTAGLSSDHAVSICIVNFNGERYLHNTLQAVYAQDTRFNEIVLVDNASQDNGLSLVRRHFSQVRIVRLPRNLGPGPARNAGLQAVASRHVLFIDNDVLLSRTCVAQLMEAMTRHPRAAAAMPRIIYSGNRNLIQFDGAYSHYLGLMILSNVDVELDQVECQPRFLDSIVTACFLFDRSKWSDNQPFDEDMPIYYEDHDFGLRLRLAGHQIVAVPEAQVFHGEGTSGLSYRRGGSYHPLRIHHLVLNRWQILLKTYAIRTLLLTLPMLLIYEFFQLAGMVKKGWLRQWMEAVRRIVTRFDGIMARRRFVQSFRREADRALLCGGPLPFTQELTNSALERTARKILDRLAIGYWAWLQRVI